MSDLIYRHDALEAMSRISDSICEAEAVDALCELPEVDAVPVRHGKWIIWDEIIAGIYHTVSECSECGFTTDKMSRGEMLYCPNCGCRMDKERK